MNPRTGRFTQEDPARDGLNYYTYVYNNPLRFVDPLGLWGEDVHYHMTYQWALDAGFSEADARLLAYYTYAIDSDPNLSPFSNNQSYHFNRSAMGDSRRINANERFEIAAEMWVEVQRLYAEIAKYADNPNDSAFMRRQNSQMRSHLQSQVDPLRHEALMNLGYGLHAMQDIEAHGNVGVNSIRVPFTGQSFHMPNGFFSWLGGRLDNVDYVWSNSSRTSVTHGNGSQTRLDATQTATMRYLNNFLNPVVPGRRIPGN
jgi:hypothetical protein